MKIEKSTYCARCGKKIKPNQSCDCLMQDMLSKMRYAADCKKTDNSKKQIE